MDHTHEIRLLSESLMLISNALQQLADEKRRENDMTEAQIAKQDENLKNLQLLNMVPIGGMQ